MKNKAYNLLYISIYTLLTFNFTTTHTSEFNNNGTQMVRIGGETPGAPTATLGIRPMNTDTSSTTSNENNSNPDGDTFDDTTEIIISQISRSEALEKLEEATTTLFDKQSATPLQESIDDLTQWKEYLNPTIDQKIIKALTFLEQQKPRFIKNNQFKITIDKIVNFVVEAQKQQINFKKIPMSQELNQKTDKQLAEALAKKAFGRKKLAYSAFKITVLPLIK